MLDTRIGPGETVPVHTHRWPGVLYIFSTAHIVRRDHEGRVLTDTRGSDVLPGPGSAFWTAAMPPHSVENVGSSEIRMLNIGKSTADYSTAHGAHRSLDGVRRARPSRRDRYAGLETFANPGVAQVEMTSDELTAVCPVTGQPDLYR